MKNKPRLAAALRPFAALATTLVLLAGCGGGGGESTTTSNDGALSVPSTPASTTFGASQDWAGVCTLEGQKRFTRSYLDEVYLWYKEIVDVDASKYNSVADYFNALLVRKPDVNGLPKDRFSAVPPASQAEAILAQKFVQADPQALLASHSGAVPQVKVVNTPGRRAVGYIQFSDHAVGAQDDLIAAVRTLQPQGIQDLVVDMRANSGGYLYISLALGSMIAGPTAEGRVFESLRYNDKRSLESSSSYLAFSSRLQFAEDQFPKDSVLPQLNLSRVYILTSGTTCSASESLINALRGIDVTVHLIGTTTCGKPYGFRRKDNCGLAYFPIEFQGTNAKGYGDYTAGFTPTCRVADRASIAPGSTGDPLLTAALSHMDTGTCPAGTALGNVLASGDPQVTPVAPTRPAWAGRLLAP